jgi:hypothetical protein
VLTGSSGLFEEGMGSTFPRRSSYEFVAERVAYTFYDPAQATPELVQEVYEIVNDNYKALRVLKIAREAQRSFVAPWLHEINIPTALIWGSMIPSRLSTWHMAFIGCSPKPSCTSLMPVGMPR